MTLKRSWEGGPLVGAKSRFPGPGVGSHPALEGEEARLGAAAQECPIGPRVAGTFPANCSPGD